MLFVHIVEEGTHAPGAHEAVMLITLIAMASSAALIPGSASPLTRISRPAPYTSLVHVVMNKNNDEGFNSFRRWPSSATVSLTSRASTYFGLDDDESEWDELKELKDGINWDLLIDSRPMADQRGEIIQLDVDEKGHLEWTKSRCDDSAQNV